MNVALKSIRQCDDNRGHSGQRLVGALRGRRHTDRGRTFPMEANMSAVCCVCAHLLSHVRLFAAPKGSFICQAPLSMGFSRQEYWSGLPFPPPGGLRDARIESASLMSPNLA